MSNSVGSSADSSAAAWAGSTLDAAEAYAQSEADAAAAERDEAERNAVGAEQPDGIDPMPTPEERAADTFWNNDPNGPASSNPAADGADNAGDEGRVSVQLTPEEAAAFAATGMTVTSDGNGGYYLDSNEVQTVAVTEQAEPDPTTWLPGSDSGTPVDNSPPVSPPQPEAPAQEAKPTEAANEAGKPEEPKTKHPVKDIDKLKNLDPDFRKKAEQFIEKMQEKGWRMRVVWATRSEEENNALVERGTASKTSKHLDGQAVDLVNRDDPYPADKNNPYYKDMESTAKEVGVTWGGDFKSRWDPTHFEAKQ